MKRFKGNFSVANLGAFPPFPPQSRQADSPSFPSSPLSSSFPHHLSLVKYSFNTLSSESDAIAVEEFFADKKERAAFVQGLAQGLDTVRSKAKWLERDAKDVEEWLEANGYLSK